MRNHPKKLGVLGLILCFLLQALPLSSQPSGGAGPYQLTLAKVNAVTTPGNLTAGNIITPGTLDVTATATLASTLKLSSTGLIIGPNANTNGLSIRPGSTSAQTLVGGGATSAFGTGALIALYGTTHATLAGKALYRAGLAAGAQHEFYDYLGTLRITINETTALAVTGAATVSTTLTVTGLSTLTGGAQIGGVAAILPASITLHKNVFFDTNDSIAGGYSVLGHDGNGMFLTDASKTRLNVNGTDNVVCTSGTTAITGAATISSTLGVTGLTTATGGVNLGNTATTVGTNNEIKGTSGGVIINAKSGAYFASINANSQFNMLIGYSVLAGAQHAYSWTLGTSGAISGWIDYSNGSTNMVSNVPTGGAYAYRVGNAQVAALSGAGQSFTANGATLTGTLPSLGSNSAGGSMFWNVPASQSASVYVNAVEKQRFDGTALLTNVPLIIANSATPATSGATGTTGQIAWDANYIYVCTATNTWHRTAHATW